MSKLIQIGKTLAKLSQPRILSLSTSTRFLSTKTPGSEERDSPISEPWIPPYEPRVGEAVETIRSRLLYQSRKRGMLENGILLSTFAAKYLQGMSEGELKEYDRLINLPSNDWDIYYWATGVKPIPSEFDTPILQKFIGHVRNTNKEQRFKQPDLN